MKVVIAPDSFKECLTATEVCAAMARGVRMADPDALVVEVPMADGGEGTIDAVAKAISGTCRTVEVHDPLGNPIRAAFLLTDQGTAVIESAAACGLPLIPLPQRDPRLTSTFGVGQLIKAAIDSGAQKCLLTVGGSGTVDGGTGLARALGYRFLDADGEDLPEGGGFLNGLARIVPPSAQLWRTMTVEVLCDVTNPLLGKQGAAEVFAPQKGATPTAVEQLSLGLQRLASIIARDLDCDVTGLTGGGAAGGMAAGAKAFLDAELVSGVDAVAECVNLPAIVTDADLVFTGEGKTDTQTVSGKVCAGVGRIASENGVPCIVLSGAVGPEVELSLEVTAAASVSRGPQELNDALTTAEDDLCAAALAFTRVFQAR